MLEPGKALLTGALPPEALVRALRDASGLRKFLAGDPSQQNPEETKSFEGNTYSYQSFPCPLAHWDADGQLS